MKYLIDSHVVDWARNADHRLSPKVRSLLDESLPGDLALCDTTLSELARHLVSGKIKVNIGPDAWLETATTNFVILPITPAIALHAARLDWDNRDPCDRHIVATAVVHKLPLLTIDERIHALVGVRGLKVIW